LLKGEGEDASEAAQLAHHLFNYQRLQSDPATAARVLLLSATPYKMYTLAQEADQDDHYADFERTLGFLLPLLEDRQQVAQFIRGYRESLLRITHGGLDSLLAVKAELENALRRVMVRTERLATTADRNGMLVESLSGRPRLLAADVKQYLHLQDVARSVGHDEIMDYWKSAPYLLNFMEDYELKRKVRRHIELNDQTPEFVRAARQAVTGMLARDEIEKYRKLDPGNARLRALHEDLIQRGVWRLLWIPPSLPYYEPGGKFADPAVALFTKRLVFSCWRVVPKAIASVLSYEAEREMMQTFRKKSLNTLEARKKRRALLRFAFSKGRPSGMPVLGLIYPCQFLARQFDPLVIGLQMANGDGQVPIDQMVASVAAAICSALESDLSRAATRPGPADDAWYWAAPLLLDQRHHQAEMDQWFAQANLAELWNGADASGDPDAVGGWSRHIQLARDFLNGRIELGPPPDDLCDVAARMATLRRSSGGSSTGVKRQTTELT
jgi:hypothetical protein